MKLLSVNVGHTRTLRESGRAIESAIFKTCQNGPVQAARNGLEGDEQADLEVHGGPDKAVYAFPFEHYEFYRDVLKQEEYAFGQFGENFTIDGFLEDQVFIGDRLKIGSAWFQVTQPRVPCLKLGLRLNDRRVLQVMVNTLRTGFYLRVLEEGSVESGDIIEHHRVEGPSMTVSEIAALHLHDKRDRHGALRAASLAGLSAEWKRRFSTRARSLMSAG